MAAPVTMLASTSYSHDNTASDQARMFNGDVHNGDVYLGDVLNGSQSFEDKVLESLSFPGMNGHRERPIEAFNGTYDWILDGITAVHVCERCEVFDDLALKQHLDSPEAARLDWSDHEACRKHWSEEDVYCQCCSLTKRDRVRNAHSARFRTWLEHSTSEVFWIRGKPGSGKSTLMNHILDRLNERDSTPNPFSSTIIAAHFFWIAGTSLQRSLIGLMRNLLYQILGTQTHLIANVFGKQRAVMSGHHKIWSHRHLHNALLEVLRQIPPDVRVIVLIDGLDESTGDAQDLVDFLGELNSFPVTKVCVASRVNNSFTDAYGQEESLRLTMQDVNHVDIDLYVRSRLEQMNSSKRFALSQSVITSISEIIRERAEGVFLWVQLAVDDVRRGIDAGDKVMDLEERVERLPPELDEFIQRIFDSIEEQHKNYAARLFMGCLKTERFPVLWTLSIHEEVWDEDFALHAPVGRLSKGSLQLQKERATSLVHAWGKGLLVVQGPSGTMPGAELLCNDHDIEVWWTDSPYSGEDTRMQFYHRSVFDFFKEKRADGSLAKIADQDYQPRLTSCRTALRVFKYYGSSVSVKSGDLWNVAHNFCMHSRQLEDDLNWSDGAHNISACSSSYIHDIVRLWKELHRVAQVLIQDRHWIFAFNARVHYHEVFAVVSPDLLPRDSYGGVVMLSLLSRCSQTFLALLGLVSEQEKRNLVNVWVLCAVVPKYLERYIVDVKVIDKLFELGADVNASISSLDGLHHSVWQLNLRWIYDHASSPPAFERTFKLQLVDMLLSYGADPDAYVHPTERYSNLAGKGWIRAVDLFDPAAQIQGEFEEDEEDYMRRWDEHHDKFGKRLDFYRQVQDRLKAASEAKAKAKAEQEVATAAGPSTTTRKKRLIKLLKRDR